MRTMTAALAGFLLVSPSGLAAQETERDTERFRLEKTDDGYVRMDTRTGAMAICRERSGELVCRPASDQREAGDPESGAGQFEALRERLTELEARVEALESGREGDPGALPSEEEFEQTLGLMERFFRRFMDIVRGLEEDINRDQGTETPPANRT